jgi:23S rRNA pseudouridine1911/1915/1917 synthase
MRKVYLAVVEGRPPSDEGRLVHCLERRERSVRIVPHATPLGREARLAYRVRETAGGRSLVEIELETGRKHQIRLQLAHCGCPIMGDVRYGASAPLPSRQIALLAREISVEHPTRQETLTFTASAPAGWPWPTSGPPEPAPFWNWSDYAPALRGHV